MGIPCNVDKSWYFYYKWEKKGSGVGQYRANHEFLLELIERTIEEHEFFSAKVECRLFSPPKNILWSQEGDEQIKDFYKRAKLWCRNTDQEYKLGLRKSGAAEEADEIGEFV